MKKYLWIILILGTMVTCYLYGSPNLFYNFLLLPLLGAIAYASTKDKWYLPVMGMGAVVFIWQVIAMALEGSFEQKLYFETLSGAATLTFIYLFLILLGISLCALLMTAFTKSKENMKFARIISGVVGIGIVLGIASLYNAFMGNPISAHLAQTHVEKYIQENYMDMDLEVAKASYNFKFDCYSVQVKSKTSVDTHFSVETDIWGRIENDNYKGAVLSGANTFNRLNQVYEDYAEPYIKENMPYEFDMIIAQLGDKENTLTEKVELDADYIATEIPVKGNITVYLYSDDLTWENVAKVTLELDALMQKGDLDVSEYTVVLEPLIEKTENKGESFGIYDFPKEKLESPDLAKDMEMFFNNWNQEKK